MADGQIGESTDLFKLFVGQIPKEMDEISLRQYFEEFGPIVEVSIIRDNITMLSKGCAFVTYSYEHSAQMAMDKLHDKVQLPNSMNALQVRFAETQVDRDNKLFIGMLPKTLGEQDLHDLFSMYGELREVHVIRGPEGGAKGCAFVKFVEREAAVAAIENLNDTIPAGATRPLVVKFADGKKPAGKEDPWQGQQLPQTYRPMGSSMHMGGQHLQQPASQQQQQRMMYQYPTMGQVVGVPGMQQLSSPYGQQGQASPVMLQAGQPQQQQRYMYMQQSPPGPQGQPGAYYSPPNTAGGQQQQQLPPSIQGSGSGELSADPVSPMYGSQHSPQDLLASKPAPQEGEYGRISPPPGQGQGLEVLPPAQSQQQQQFPLDSESSHVRPPEGPSGANLFIYHLPRDLTDADLATLFAPFGNVISAKVFVDKKTSDSKGFGFVSYDTLENANSAIESMNGFQIGSKRLKVQHKRVLGSNPPGQHSPYGPPHMQQHHHHMGGQQQHGQHSLYQSPQQQQQQLQNPSYYRPSPGLGGGAGGMMGAPMLGQPNAQQQHLQYGAMGVQSQQQPQPHQMGLGQYGMRAAPLGAGGRMQQPQPGGPLGVGVGAGGVGAGGGGGARGVGSGVGGYGYSYPTLGAYPVPGASMQQPQQQLRPAPGMQSARVDMYGTPAGMQQQQQQPGSGGGSMAYPSNDQHAALAGAQSTHGAISYMDANSGGKPQQQSSNVSGFYGQY